MSTSTKPRPKPVRRTIHRLHYLRMARLELVTDSRGEHGYKAVCTCGQSGPYGSSQEKATTYFIENHLIPERRKPGGLS